MSRDVAAPAPSTLRRAGAILLAACLLAACDRAPLPGSGPELQLEDESIRLPRGARVHTVEIGVQQGGFSPAVIEASVGDALRFTADDALLHDVAFDPAALTREAHAYLDSTNQLRSPPLVSRGATWVVSLEEAPPGRYPFSCTTHHERGELTIQP